MKDKITVFWFRRDLRLTDNRGLSEALKGPHPVLPLFIFDENILEELEPDDPRVSFIYDNLRSLSEELVAQGSGLLVKKGKPAQVWRDLLKEYAIVAVYANEDYEPYARRRDAEVADVLQKSGVAFRRWKDQVVFRPDEVLKQDGTPYSVFTPYKKAWLRRLSEFPEALSEARGRSSGFLRGVLAMPTLEELGFKRASVQVRPFTLDFVEQYEEVRNYPALDRTSSLSPHLRFGTVSVREIVRQTMGAPAFVAELIWREFFMQILWHFPESVQHNFRRKYDGVQWRNDAAEFEKWKRGQTGYPLVDAGMRQLNATGTMHNRVRMVVAGFLCKHLLIDWRWGEAYFARKLLDYEMASNVGNWQWAAGTGCDAAPYFRIFNPAEQLKKFDPEWRYVKQWVPEIGTSAYPVPMVEHAFARKRAIEAYKRGIDKVS